jgi:hypothetical protein
MSDLPPPCPKCASPTQWLYPLFCKESLLRKVGAVGGWTTALVLVGAVAAPFPFTLPAIAALAAAGVSPAIGYKGGEKLGRALDEKPLSCECTNPRCGFRHVPARSQPSAT